MISTRSAILLYNSTELALVLEDGDEDGVNAHGSALQYPPVYPKLNK